MKIEWEEELSWMLRRAMSDVGIVDLDMLTRNKVYSTREMVMAVEREGLGGRLDKLREVLHCNIMGSFDEKERGRWLMENLRVKHNYAVDRGGGSGVVVNLVMPSELVPRELRVVEGGVEGGVKMLDGEVE